MNQSNLQCILKLKEFSQYLDNMELTNLSMCSSNIRECLLPEIFNSFNFSGFNETKKYKRGFITCFCEEYEEIKSLLNITDTRSFGWLEFTRNFYKPLTKDYIDSKARFQSDLNQLPFRPKKLKLNNISGYDYLVYDLYSAFFNINILSINFSNIQFEVLKYLLDNLTYLEDLEIVGNTFIKCDEESNSYSINWPLNLKKLNFGDNYICFINTNEDYIELGFPRNRMINYMAKYLPSLHTLALKLPNGITRYFPDNYNQLLAFLKLNSHVKSLDIHFHQFEPVFFEIDIESFKVIKAPTLPNLKCLDLRYYCDISIIDVIFEHFPNITDLSYYPKTLNINNTHLYASTLEKLQSLKKLKLIPGCPKPINKTIKLPKLKNLESVEFIGQDFRILNILTTKLRSCPNLKTVKFWNRYKRTLFDHPEITPELEKRCKFLQFPDSQTFYKLK
ncbi:hypothetical protein CONCODRAFT_13181 [Conidiobolus coronatus NRRL 28638]|uniref:F-box domain-containing protein n=1 Tax=Conidiobolus coronatus (strain ATCC 28846 / CBS 209.66 / NRRL 28638) TaxID=796925 RepID=A0A137NR86_CONC2|nr:hypothetical protein CONCODRAFT_13181 [Conidiobolus coronatus NRRL 28638]|eukprot:KXN65283.1 hypothetical protein CONCODRAFT_13181 [Conidiobolus coronatus NRRL 28638]